MPRVKKICKECGKEYIACSTPNPYGVFRWRDVACSIDCASKYLQRVEDARKNAERAEDQKTEN